ncbi:hypothetical protein E3E35_09325 [Thermococcus sp. GR7]|uniref:hypothetical protein n=1 Tax=unclassified Thermococcus TaxID=2627626 RepID=UPI00142FC0DE|nr:MULTISPECIES: hypothetical protein [unclassified Thermococcus]NJE47592.1 hypothetical protein [Thermococcus sp. GR7]NJE79379.1 hypothetical protein [Thermococcus sp. GR4]NJF22452.1 hypothetical protein [Thermococcus sp. GR5]
MLTELLVALFWALVGFSLALIIWRRNRFRASLFRLSLSMTLEVAYIEKRSVPLKHIILGLLVFLASAMIVSQGEGTSRSLGRQYFSGSFRGA